MNILITGASGFIGQNLIYLMEHTNINDQLILLTSHEIKSFKCILHNNFTFKVDDFLANGISTIDVIIHLGSFTPKSMIQANKVINCNSNIYNTEYLLDNIPSIPKKFIYLSSIDVYQNTSSLITEDTITLPTSLYGYSKLYCEKMLEKWAEENNIILQILRIGHVYGKGEDEYHKIIPECIKTVIKDKQPLIYTNGTEKRAFINVKDVCRLIVNSIKLDQYEGPINITSNNFISIIDLVNTIIHISEKNMQFELNESINISRDMIFDNRKMQTLLGHEEVDLINGLKEEYLYFLSKNDKDYNIDGRGDID